MHRVIRGIFGFSIVIVPIILLITAYYTEKREGMSLSRAAAVQRRTDGTGEQLFPDHVHR